MIPILIYLIIGIFAGLLSGLLGVGGGLIVVPALLLTFQWLDFPSTYGMHVVIGTSLSSMVLTTASSAWAHYQQNGIFWPLVKPLTPGIILGAILGALVATYLPGKQLERGFGIFAVLLGIFLIIPNKFTREGEVFSPPSPYLIGALGTAIGAISSALGIGGGIITVPALMFFYTPIRSAISTSAITSFLIALVGAISFLVLGLRLETSQGSIGYLYLPAFLCISLTSVFAAAYGAKLAYILPTHALRKIFGLLMICLGVLMAW